MLADMHRLDIAQSATSTQIEIVVGIPTRGRPGILVETIADLARQSRPADQIVVAYAESEDIGDAESRFPSVTFLKCALGLTRQRNAILELAKDVDLLVFLDDDFYLDSQYLEVIERLFQGRKDVVVATGQVLADGINGPGLTAAEARVTLVNRNGVADGGGRVCTVFNAYGCNMCVRMAPIREHRICFDEHLPLYGWYEDVDFSRQLARHGSVVMVNDAVGIHLGSKSGRTSGVRLGYSQVANPIYLMQKGTFPRSHALYSISMRFLKNLVMSVTPEPYVDRRGRLRGNLLGLRDLIVRKLCPMRVLTL